MTVENFNLQNINKRNNAKIKSLELQLKKSKHEISNTEKKLMEIFSKGQIKKLKQGTKRLNWTEEDIARSITLYSASAKAYKLLKKKAFPLPAVRTLQCWAKKLDITPGILQPVMKLMLAATQLDETQKVCVLSFDEMKIRKTYCYDRSSDSTLHPVSYVQVAMLRGKCTKYFFKKQLKINNFFVGLMAKWKQPKFYAFDCKMTQEIIYEILAATQKYGYHFVAMVSDLGGGNRGLYSDFHIEVDKPW